MSSYTDRYCKWRIFFCL